MIQFNLRLSRRIIILIGGSLVVVLVSVNLLLHYNVFAPGLRSDAAGLPVLASSPTGAAGLPAGPHDVDENYRRAVTSQLAQISEEDGLSASSPTPDIKTPPAPRQATPHQEVSVTVNTVDVPLNVRAQPGTSAPVIGSLAPGTPLTAIGLHSEGDWILVHIPNRGEPGWVFAGLVRVTAGDLSTLRQIAADVTQE